MSVYTKVTVRCDMPGCEQFVQYRWQNEEVDPRVSAYRDGWKWVVLENPTRRGEVCPDHTKDEWLDFMGFDHSTPRPLPSAV